MVSFASDEVDFELVSLLLVYDGAYHEAFAVDVALHWSPEKASALNL